MLYFIFVYIAAASCSLYLCFHDKENTTKQPPLTIVAWVLLSVVPVLNVIFLLFMVALSISGFFIDKAVTGVLDSTSSTPKN